MRGRTGPAGFLESDYPERFARPLIRQASPATFSRKREKGSFQAARASVSAMRWIAT